MDCILTDIIILIKRGKRENNKNVIRANDEQVTKNYKVRGRRNSSKLKEINEG